MNKGTKPAMLPRLPAYPGGPQDMDALCEPLGFPFRKRRNVALLAERVRDYHARGGRLKLRMGFWASTGEGGSRADLFYPADVGRCGTAACFAGHAPVCGFEPMMSGWSGKREDWIEYVDRLFPAHGPLGDDPGPGGAEEMAHRFLFCSDHCDDLGQALARAAFLLSHGVDPAFAKIYDEVGLVVGFDFREEVKGYRVPAWFRIDWDFVGAVSRGEA